MPNSDKRTFNIVAIGTSLGGLKALKQILSDLPANFPAPIVVAQHVSAMCEFSTPKLLDANTKLQVKTAENGEHLQPGKVYIAPPKYHMRIEPNKRICLYQANKINFVRPSIDVLFESVANLYKECALAIVLTGMGTDGAKGIQFIKQNGGKVFVQDEKSCESFAMPTAALATGCVDLVLSLEKIAYVLKENLEIFKAPLNRNINNSN